MDLAKEIASFAKSRKNGKGKEAAGPASAEDRAFADFATALKSGDQGTAKKHLRSLVDLWRTEPDDEE
uniref:Uncharacterized protein n=1 Tax=viral metagenome TaxID=1070528 RepID=A0A6M3XDQ3_9ZZZZ